MHNYTNHSGSFYILRYLCLNVFFPMLNFKKLNVKFKVSKTIQKMP